jgi:hypothetical protein
MSNIIYVQFIYRTSFSPVQFFTTSASGGMLRSEFAEEEKEEGDAVRDDGYG